MENDKSAQIEKRFKYIILAFCAVVIIGLMFVICERNQPTDAAKADLCNKLVLEQSMLTRDIAALETSANQVDMHYKSYYERIKRYNDMPNGHWARQQDSTSYWMVNTSNQFRSNKRYFQEALAANRSMYKEKCQKK